jgi:hypothetical protein
MATGRFYVINPALIERLKKAHPVNPVLLKPINDQQLLTVS